MAHVKPLATSVRLTESLRIFEGTITKASIGAAFAAVRDATGATTQRTWISEIESGNHQKTVSWSMWIGRSEPPPGWYAGPELQDRRHLLAVVLECDGYVATTSSLAGDLQKHFPCLKVPAYDDLVGLRDLRNAEFLAVRAQRLATARAGVHQTTTVGRSLEKTMARSSARRSVPATFRFAEGGAEWRISPSSGRLGRAGGRVDLAAVCRYFSDLIHFLQNPPTRTGSFLDAYAHPIDFSQVGVAYSPTTLRFDASIVTAFREGMKVVQLGGATLAHAATATLEADLARTWDLTLVPGKKAPEWDIHDGPRVIGQLVRLKEQFSLRSPHLGGYEVVDPTTLEKDSLRDLFHEGELPYLVAFTDPRVLYLGKQLFRDEALLGEVPALIAILKGMLPVAQMEEKKVNAAQTGFDATALFGFVEAQCANADFLVLEDLGSELADYISIEGQTVTYWHCKAGSPKVGASGLHEVVSQALKNLSVVRATEAEFQARSGKWQGTWNNHAAIPRLRRGVSVAAFLARLKAAMAGANYHPRVVLVVGGLRAAAMSSALSAMQPGVPAPSHVTQALWLLSTFVDACKEQSAEVEVVCEP